MRLLARRPQLKRDSLGGHHQQKVRHDLMRGFHLVVLSLLLPSCQQRPAGADQYHSTPRRELPPPGGRVQSVVLVDSVMVNLGPTSRQFFRVAVRYDSSLDTVSGLLTSALPTLVADTVVLGLAYGPTADSYDLFRYLVPKRRLERLQLPPGLDPNLTGLAFAPDGKYLAYVRFPGNETGLGTVRKWPGGQVVSETPPVPVDAGDVLAGEARWMDATRFELFIDSHGYGWLRFRGSVNRPGFAVDTLGAGLSDP